MRDRKFQLKVYQKKILVKISIILILGICILLVGLLISFFFYIHIVGSPYLNKLRGVMDPATYNTVLQEFGYYNPLIIQFREYLFNFFSGKWGNSYIVAPGMPVTEVIINSLPRTIKIIIIPLVLGIPLGIFLGKASIRNRDNWKGKSIRIFTIIGLATPIFFISVFLRFLYTVEQVHPDLEHALDFIVPVFSLSFIIIALITKQTQTKMEKKSIGNSIISNSFITGKMFGFVFASIVMIELIYNIRGLSYYFMFSIYGGDLFVINGFLFMVTIFFIVTLIISNLIPLIYKFIRPRLLVLRVKIIRKKEEDLKPNPNELNNKAQKMGETSPKIDLKDYLLKILKSPFTIIGLILILFFIFISVFPQLITSYSLEEITRPYTPPDPWFEGPSSQHPLGTSKYGYDVLALLIWGTREALLVGSGIVLIGLIGGAILGFFAAKLSRFGYNAIIGLTIVFYIIPGLFLVGLFVILFGIDNLNIIFMIGFLFIPSFTRIISNAILREADVVKIIKTIIISIPLEIAFAILSFHFLGFIGLADETRSQLGISFSYGIYSPFSFRAWFWPGFFIFLIMLSLILLHEGLKTLFKDRDLSN